MIFISAVIYQKEISIRTIDIALIAVNGSKDPYSDQQLISSYLSISLTDAFISDVLHVLITFTVTTQDFKGLLL